MKMMIRSFAAAIRHWPAIENSSSAWNSPVSASCRARKPYEGRIVRMPTARQSTRKKVANPSTISILPNAGPACWYAATDPAIAAASPSRLKCPNACDERLPMIGSSTINSVPIAVRMISGRKRIRSPGFIPKLAGIGGLRRGRNLHVEGNVHLSLLEHLRVDLLDRLEKGPREHAHPHHHHHQRHKRRPLADIQVGHMMPDLLVNFAVKHALVHPQHVAGGENHAQGGEN